MRNSSSDEFDCLARVGVTHVTLSRGLVRLLALTCAVTVANLYYAQPLLHTIARALDTTEAGAGLVVTATQLGYAAGLLFVVPLGDILTRRPLITALLGLDAVALASSAVAPNLELFATLAVLVGLTSVVVQMIVPYAAALATDDERGRVIGTLMGGVMLGILVSRFVSGVVAELAGWRTMYAIAALLMFATAATMRQALPATPRELRIGFAAQMRGVLSVARTEPVLRWRSVIGACAFAAFSCFWTTVTFLLAGPYYHFSQLQIGLFALVGAIGVASAVLGGRMIDAHRRMRWPLTGAFLTLLTVSFALSSAGGQALGWLIGGALVMDACMQVIHVTNQTVIYELVPQARSRLATVSMTTFFVGGAAGSALGSQVYPAWGWTGACLAATAFCLTALLAWAATQRHERHPATTTESTSTENSAAAT